MEGFLNSWDPLLECTVSVMLRDFLVGILEIDEARQIKLLPVLISRSWLSAGLWDTLSGTDVICIRTLGL